MGSLGCSSTPQPALLLTLSRARSLSLPSLSRARSLVLSVSLSPSLVRALSCHNHWAGNYVELVLDGKKQSGKGGRGIHIAVCKRTQTCQRGKLLRLLLIYVCVAVVCLYC